MKRLIMAAALMVVVAGQAWGASPESVADSYVQAQKKRDYKKLYYLDYSENIVRRAYGKGVVAERISVLTNEKALPDYFPASMKHKIISVKKQTVAYNYYEKYKNWTAYNVVMEFTYPKYDDAPVADGEVIKKTMIGMSIDAKTSTIIEAIVKGAKVLETYPSVSPGAEGFYSSGDSDITVSSQANGSYKFYFTGTFTNGNGNVNTGELTIISTLAKTINYKNAPDDSTCVMAINILSDNVISVDQTEGDCDAGMNVRYGGTYRKIKQTTKK